MRAFFMANRRILLFALLGLVIGFGAGFLAGNATLPAEEGRETGMLGMPSVLPDTCIERVVTFTRCEHALRTPVESAGFVGYTKEELAAFYADYEIERFDGEQVTVARRVDGCCPAHLLLREDGDGALCVYRTDATVFAEELQRALPFEMLAELPEDTRASLREGVVFASFSDIDAFLEGIES